MESVLILSCFKKIADSNNIFCLSWRIFLNHHVLCNIPIPYTLLYILYTDKVKSVSDNVECLIHILYTYYLPIYHSYLFHSSSCFLSLLCFPSFFPSLRHSHDSHPFPFSFLIPFPSISLPLEGVGEGFFLPFH